MLAAAEEPTTGEIYINGDRLLRDQSNSTLKRRLGCAMIFRFMRDLTVWDWITLRGCIAYEIRVAVAPAGSFGTGAADQ